MRCLVSCAAFETFVSFIVWTIIRQMGMFSTAHQLDDFQSIQSVCKWPRDKGTQGGEDLLCPCNGCHVGPHPGIETGNLQSKNHELLWLELKSQGSVAREGNRFMWSVELSQRGSLTSGLYWLLQMGVNAELVPPYLGWDFLWIAEFILFRVCTSCNGRKKANLLIRSFPLNIDIGFYTVALNSYTNI